MSIPRSAKPLTSIINFDFVNFTSDAVTANASASCLYRLIDFYCCRSAHKWLIVGTSPRFCFRNQTGGVFQPVANCAKISDMIKSLASGSPGRKEPEVNLRSVNGRVQRDAERCRRTKAATEKAFSFLARERLSCVRFLCVRFAFLFPNEAKECYSDQVRGARARDGAPK